MNWSVANRNGRGLWRTGLLGQTTAGFGFKDTQKIGLRRSLMDGRTAVPPIVLPVWPDMC
jgi:hypothetical protein